jgi:hypothetical protein
VSEAVNDSFLDDMQQELVALLKADEVLSALPILDERLGDINAEVEKQLGISTAVGGKIGACVIVQSPTADDESPAVHGGIMETEWTFLVLEEPVLNDHATKGHRIRALKIARRIVRVCKLYAATGLCTALVPAKPTIVPFGNPLASIAYRVAMRTTEVGQGRNLKVAQPAIASAGSVAPQSVTITCATAGAAIYYTLDGSHPYAGNAQAVLYAGAFNVNAAGTVRARAFKTGYVGSNAAAADFT